MPITQTFIVGYLFSFVTLAYTVNKLDIKY